MEYGAYANDAQLTVPQSFNPFMYIFSRANRFLRSPISTSPAFLAVMVAEDKSVVENRIAGLYSYNSTFMNNILFKLAL